ncbi:YkgJ family cysteine cluster protein, partial [Candidatus Bathyarchaeota archaeon]|nr:YkgJ family cysteine cluster protein [Candidatus Bathyarchaeota archaeon]
DMVRPHLGRGEESVTEIFTYQHTENVCTHLVDNLCQIYENRPLMCRSFPVKIGAYGLRFSSGCKGVLHTLRKSKTMDREQYEVKAAIEMVERLHGFHTSFQDEDYRWKFNLVKEEWETY